MYTTKYKHLVVSGCSFTHNNHESHMAWPNILEAWSDLKLINLAIPGAGNTHITNSIILELEKGNYNPADTLVMIMWSGPERIDWITSAENSNFADTYPFSYKYDDENELVLAGAWWSNEMKSNVMKAMMHYAKYQSDSSLALSSWLSMMNLTNYLEQHGYDYYYTSISNLDSVSEDGNRWIEYSHELAKIGLSIDTSHWITDKFLYEFGKENNQLQPDGFHVEIRGHEDWVTEILVPALKERGVIL